MNKQEWLDSNRGDHMLREAKKRGVDLRVLTRVKVECAKLVKHLMVDERSLKALEVAEAFADGKVTREELDAACDAAYAAANTHASVAAVAHTAASAAAFAVDADFSLVARSVSFAFAAAADDYDDYDDAYGETLAKCADICRQYIKFEGIK